MDVSHACCSTRKFNINSRVLHFFIQLFISFEESIFYATFYQSLIGFMQKLIFKKIILKILGQYLFNELRYEMSIKSVSITNTKQEMVSFHKVLNNDISILIDFLFFLRSESSPVAKSKLGYNIFLIRIFFRFTVFGKKFTPLLR